MAVPMCECVQERSKRVHKRSERDQHRGLVKAARALLSLSG